MNSNENFKFHGSMTAILQKADGTIETTHKDNLILNVGFDFIADAIGKASGRPAVMSQIAVGTSTTAPTASQTAMLAEIGRKAATYAHTAGTKTFTFTTTFNAGEATGALTESGVVNATTGGIFIDRLTFPVINKGVDDVVTIIFTFSMS